MEPEESYRDQIDTIYSCSDSLVNKLSEDLLKGLHKTPEELTILFADLMKIDIYPINFHKWSDFARMLTRSSIRSKKPQILFLLGDYFLKAAHHFFPGPIGTHNTDQLKPVLKLSNKPSIRIPENYIDQLHIILYLQGQVDENWKNGFIEYLLNQIIVDKKNQDSKGLKMNPYFADFISANFGKLVPQLERLMVRSQSNLDVIAEFLQSFRDLKNIGQHSAPLLKKYKNLFLTRPDTSHRFVYVLASALNSEEQFIINFEIIKGLLTAEHNAKKKIVYFKMLEGFIQSIKKFKLSEKLANQILVLVVNCWIKFTEQIETNNVLDILQKILPLVTNPGPEIAEACKQHLKSANKSVLIFLGLTLSEVYNKSQHFEEFGAVKDAHKTLKAQVDGYLKKKQANWHFILVILNFLATYDASILQNLSEIKSLFKSSCLALRNIQQNNALILLEKYYRYLQQQEGQEIIEISNELALTTVILLQQNRSKNNLELFKDKNDLIKLQLLTQGVYPLVYFNIDKNSKNKGNRYVSLIRLLFFTLKIKLNPGTQHYERLITLVNYANLKLSDFIDKKPNEQNEKKGRQISEKYLKLRLGLDIDQKIVFESHVQQLIKKNANVLIALNLPENFDQILGNLLKKQFYEKNRSWLQETEKGVRETIKQFIDEHKQIETELIQLQYYTEKKVQQKKIYLGTIIDARMMNQSEVKEQQYKQHFSKMLKYLENILDIILSNIKVHHFIEGIWQRHFESIIHIVTYPEHRMLVYKFVKASFETISETKLLSKLFLRFSGFLGDFYAIRGAHMTPEISTMEKCQKFLPQFLLTDYIKLDKNSFILKFINDLCLYVLENMEFDLSVKQESLAFFRCAIQKDLKLDHIDEIFTILVKNINIIANNQDIPLVLEVTMKKIQPDRYTELFTEILNYVKSTKRLILLTLIKINQTKIYDPSFEDYIKLRILSLDDSDQIISSSAEKILKNQSKNVKSIAHFDMKNFIKNNTKDTIEKLCRFMTEETTPKNIDDVFALVIKTANKLYDDHFDQEGLEFLPYFLTLNMESIPENYLHHIFQLLIMKYTANQDFATLSRMSVDIGVQIIKKYAPKNAEKLLKILEQFLTSAKGISNIVFLGVLAPYLKGNKNMNAIQEKITELFKGQNQKEQISIAKAMPDLMSFFKNSQDIIETIFNQISTYDKKTQLNQSYLFVGLLKGLGHKTTIAYLDKTIAKDYPSKTYSEKLGRCYLLRAFVNNFGKIIELRALKVIQILLGYMSDQNQEVRNFSKSVTQIFVTRMSSYGIKQLLPPLLNGLQTEQNWRIKISHIWILGIMANCAAKQLQTSLPIIVPTLSTCLSNAHPMIREKAAEALNLIGQTIKNPEISQTIDILIEALQNPFEKSEKAIQLLLQTRFSHYIDPPSLSLIVPIIDYSLRGRVSQLKEGACQVLGSISELILNPSDILPYLKVLSIGIKTAICDPLPEIRSIAAMAVGKISNKIGAVSARQYFDFIFQLIDSHNSNTTEKTGAAQAYAEIICSQDYDYFEQSLTHVFNKLSQEKSSQKEGYILIFLYVPAIRRAQFEGFIKQVNQNTYCYVSDQEESLRNSSMQVSKVLINNYGISHTQLLLEPLCEGVFGENWRKRNAALILLGQLLNVLKSHMFHNKTNDKASSLYQAMMAVYIMKDDDLEMPRATANQVWNAYIENTPKTIKSGLGHLVLMWTKFTHCASGVVYRNIVSFSGKYGENFFSEILQYLWESVAEPEHNKGTFEVMGEFIKRLSQQFLLKGYQPLIVRFFDTYLLKINNANRGALTKCLALYIQKMHQQEYFENLIYPQIDKMSGLNEEDPVYTETLHLVRDLLNTTSATIVDRLISKVTTPPLSQFTIEVITNNADKIANNLYTLFDIPATQTMLQQVFTLLDKPEKEIRLSLLIYCLNQVSIRLNKNFKSAYVKMIIREMRVISNGNKPYGTKAIEKILEMLVFFLNSVPLNEIDTLDQLIGEITPYIFKGTNLIKQQAHKIFIILISDTKSTQTALYYRQLIVSLENNKSEAQIWTEKDIVKDYINILVKGLAYGHNDNIEDNLELLKFLIKETKKTIIAPMVVRIVGPIIRIASYPLLNRQKEKVLEILQEIYNAGYQIQVYNHQIVSVCTRLLFEQRNNIKINQIMQLISKILHKVFETSVHRQVLLNLVIKKVKVQGQCLIQLLSLLISNIFKTNSKIFPKSSYQDLRHQFYTLLTNNEHRMTNKGIYYLSKLCGMISAFIKSAAPQNMESVNCTYEDLLVNIHLIAYNKEAVPKMDKIQIFIKESSREKVYYLLKAIIRARKGNKRTQETYTQLYVQSLVPQTLSGFDDIIDVVEDFE